MEATIETAEAATPEPSPAPVPQPQAEAEADGEGQGGHSGEQLAVRPKSRKATLELSTDELRVRFDRLLGWATRQSEKAAQGGDATPVAFSAYTKPRQASSQSSLPSMPSVAPDGPPFQPHGKEPLGVSAMRERRTSDIEGGRTGSQPVFVHGPTRCLDSDADDSG